MRGPGWLPQEHAFLCGRGSTATLRCHSYGEEGRGSSRYNLVAPARPGRQDPVETHEMRPRRRDQDRETLDQFQRLEKHVRRAVAPAVSEPVEETAVRSLREPLGCKGRPRGVAAQPLEPPTIACGNSDGRVEIDAADARTARRGGLLKRLDSDPVAQPADTMPGPRTGRHASAQGGPAQLGQERFFDRKHVGLVRVGRATQSAPLEQPLQAARKLSGNPQDLSVLRRIEPATIPYKMVRST